MDHNMPCQRIFGGICPECDKLQIMNKIDLDAIINIKYETSFGRAEVYKFMKEAIHQALVLASEKLESLVSELSKQGFEGWTQEEIRGYKTSSITIAGFAQRIVTDVEKLIV